MEGQKKGLEGQWKVMNGPERVQGYTRKSTFLSLRKCLKTGFWPKFGTHALSSSLSSKTPMAYISIYIQTMPIF